MADVFAPQPVKTKVAGDVVVNINTGQSVALNAGTAVVGKLGIDQTTPGVTNGVQIVTSLPSGNAVVGKLGIDQTTPGTTNGVQVVSALPAGAAVVGKFGIDQTTPGTTNGVQIITSLPTGTAIIGALVANQTVNTTQLNSVAISTGSGATTTGVQRVVLATDQTVIPVSINIPFTTFDSGQLTSISLAAGATAMLDGVQIASGVGKLCEATVSSSIALKAQLGTWDGTIFTVKRTFFVPANDAFCYQPSRYDAITMVTGTTSKFRWALTNNDNINAADVYASITYDV
jgi:hypothetical protein